MNTILKHLFGTLAAKPASANSKSKAPLALIKRSLIEALTGCGGLRANRLAFEVHNTKTPSDLWALRSELYECIAKAHSQSIAVQRINDISHLFEGWIPPRQLTLIQPDFRPSQG